MYSDFIQIDIERIRSFAAFIAKVQHNHLFEAFPHTRMLLKLYGLEMEVFKAYLEHHQKNRRKQLSRDQRTQMFLIVLKRYIGEVADSEYAGLMDVLCHEQAVWEIHRFLSKKEVPERPTLASEPVSVKSDRILDAVPSANGIIRTISYSYDPYDIITSFQKQRFDPKLLSISQRVMCYWGNAERRQLQVFEIDQAIALLLALADGHRSIAEIIEELTDELGTAVPTKSLLPFFESAIRQGILTIKIDQSKAR